MHGRTRRNTAKQTEHTETRQITHEHDSTRHAGAWQNKQVHDRTHGNTADHTGHGRTRGTTTTPHGVHKASTRGPRGGPHGDYKGSTSP
eukprot:1020204-Pyramimonas_sp.AAC.2